MNLFVLAKHRQDFGFICRPQCAPWCHSVSQVYPILGIWPPKKNETWFYEADTRGPDGVVVVKGMERLCLVAS